MFRRIKLPEEMPAIDLLGFLSVEEYKKKLKEEFILMQQTQWHLKVTNQGKSNIYNEVKDWK